MKSVIKKNIKNHGFTSVAIAEKMGVTKQTLSQIISGNPTLSKLCDIAKAMNISVSDLLNEESETTIPPVHPSGCVCPVCGARLQLTAVDADAATTARNGSNFASRVSGGQLAHPKGETPPEGRETAKSEPRIKFQRELAAKFLGGYLGDIGKISKSDLDNIRFALDKVLEE